LTHWLLTGLADICLKRHIYDYMFYIFTSSKRNFV
jgi:hypothetical protein